MLSLSLYLSIYLSIYLSFFRSFHQPLFLSNYIHHMINLLNYSFKETVLILDELVAPLSTRYSIITNEGETSIPLLYSML